MRRREFVAEANRSNLVYVEPVGGARGIWSVHPPPFACFETSLQALFIGCAVPAKLASGSLQLEKPAFESSPVPLCQVCHGAACHASRKESVLAPAMGKVEAEKRSHAIFWGNMQWPYPRRCHSAPGNDTLQPVIVPATASILLPYLATLPGVCLVGAQTLLCAMRSHAASGLPHNGKENGENGTPLMLSHRSASVEAILRMVQVRSVLVYAPLSSSHVSAYLNTQRRVGV